MSSQILLASADVQIQAAGEGRPPRVSIVAYTGGLMSVPGFGPVVLDLTGLDLGTGVPLLHDHNTELAGVVGHGKASVANHQLVVTGQLTTTTQAAKSIVELGKSGYPFQASVGVQPVERQSVGRGESIHVNGRTITADGAGFTLIRRGKLREVSIVAVGADAGTSVSIAARKGSSMQNQNVNDNATINAQMAAMLPENQAGMTEPERIQARWGREPWNDPAGLPRRRAESAMLQAAAGRISYSDFERELLNERLRDAELALIRAERPVGPGIHSSNRDTASSPDVLQAALLVHLGHENVAAKTLGDQATERGRSLKATSLVEILQAAHQSIGQDAPRDRNALIRASFSTAAISNIVSGAQNKILLDQFGRLPLLSLQLCKRVSASDFKANSAVRLVGRDTMMASVGPAGEIEHGHLQDSAATYQLATYARLYAITRQDIINDDLGALDELPKVIARGAGLKMESTFWTLVLGNSGSYFSEANGNLLSDPLDLTGLGAAVSVMRKLTDGDGEPVMVEPRFLVTPPELESAADALYTSTNVVMAGTGAAVAVQPAGNSLAGKYAPLSSPYISNANYTGNSATQWYLFADPNVGPAAFIAAFLNGTTTPTIEQSDTDFNTLGVQYRGFLDFGFAQLDKQGAVKSTGDGT